MRLLTDIKMKIEHAVEFWYEFDASRSPHSNARRALSLLTKMTFVYRVSYVSSNRHLWPTENRHVGYRN